MADLDEEHLLFVRRYMQFHHIWTVYSDLLSGKYVPSVGMRDLSEVAVDCTLPSNFISTLMFVLYAFFYSLVEDSEEGFDAFRIWRAKYP